MSTENIICACGGLYMEEEKDKHDKRPMHQIWILKNEIDKVREELYEANEKIDELRNKVSKKGKKMKKYLDKNTILKAYLSERIDEHNSN